MVRALWMVCLNSEWIMLFLFPQAFGRQVKKRKNQPKMIPKAIKNQQKIGPGTIPGLSGETWVPFWPLDGPRLKNATKKPRKYSPFLVQKWRPGPTFRGLVFYCFSRCSLSSFFTILAAPGLHFCFLFGSALRALGLWENS